MEELHEKKVNSVDGNRFTKGMWILLFSRMEQLHENKVHFTFCQWKQVHEEMSILLISCIKAGTQAKDI